jgi:hypothetical protein
LVIIGNIAHRMVSMASVPSYRASNHSHSHQDSDSSGSGDPAEWNTASYCPDPLSGLEPVTDDVPNAYRERALDCMALLAAVDQRMTQARDPRLAWVGIALGLGLTSAEGRSAAELSRQMGCFEDAVGESKARFLKLSGLGPGGGRSVPWL